MNNEDSYLQLMNNGKIIGNAAFLTFINYNNLFDSHVFCFFEGEDGKYYNRRIEDNLESSSFISIPVGNKEQVLKLLNKLSKEYSKVKKMFFIDKDFDESQPNNNDLYETPCYSIENLYIGKSSFERILKTVFNINSVDSRFNEYIKIYDCFFEEFHRIILDFNCRLFFQTQKAKIEGISFNEIVDKFNECVKLENNPKYSIKDTNYYKEYLKRLDSKLNIKSDDLENLKNNLEQQDAFKYFYGKAELKCYVALLILLCDDYNTHLKEKNKTIEQLSKTPKNKIKIPYIKKVNMAICNNLDYLATLSQFADTPPELIEFIKAHRINSLS